MPKFYTVDNKPVSEGPDNPTYRSNSYEFAPVGGQEVGDKVSVDSYDTVKDGKQVRVIANVSSSVPPTGSPYDEEPTRRVLTQEIESAMDQGYDEVDVMPTGTNVASRVAKNQGYMEEDQEGVTKLRPDPNNQARSAASPVDATLAAYEATKAGYSNEEITERLMIQGFTPDEAAYIMEDSVKVGQAFASGYNYEDVRGFLGGQVREATQTQDTTQPIEIDPEVMVKSDAARKLLDKETQQTASELLSSLKVVQPNMSSVSTRVAAFAGHRESAVIAEEATRSAAQKIANLAAARGLQVQYNPTSETWQAVTERGLVDVTPSVWQDIAGEKFEIGGSIAGGSAGLRVGLAAPVPNPYVKAAVVTGTTLAGAVTGAVAGTEADYLYESMQLHMDMEAEVAAHKALTAAEATAIGSIIGGGVVGGVKGGWKFITGAKNMILDGNTEGAYRALKEGFFITDEQADEMVRALGAKGTVAGKTNEEQAIAAFATTQPGGETLVKAAGAMDPQAGRAVVQAVDERAQNLLKVTSELTDENIGKIVRGDLEGYTTAVKENFNNVKMQAANSPLADNFAFDYKELALDPVLETLKKNITDPTVLQRYVLQMERIRGMSDSRTFSDLLELRQLVNEFKFNKRITSAKDFKQLNNVLTSIDGAIEEGAEAVLPNPKQWLGDYAKVRADYGEMKKLERNVLFRLLNRQGADEKAVVRGLSKYITSLDGTFTDVMQQLPKQTRTKVEGAVVDNLANKYTAGLEGGKRAVHFPMLAKELDAVSLTTPDARRLKQAVGELAEVFRNDIPLAQASGQIQIPKFQSYLTTDPVVRAKFEVASGIFNYMKTLAPGQTQRNMALVRQSAKLLEQPMNTNNLETLMKEAGHKVDILPSVQRMVERAAQQKSEGIVGAPRIKLYGDGKVLSARGSGKETSIPVHRIAGIRDINDIAEAYGVNPADQKAIEDILRRQGYSAMQIGSDTVRRLN